MAACLTPIDQSASRITAEQVREDSSFQVYLNIWKCNGRASNSFSLSEPNLAPNVRNQQSMELSKQVGILAHITLLLRGLQILDRK